MDTETLAAVHWADDHLAAGSRIAADRISGDLLSSQARLWTVRGSTADEAWLYFADQWGPPQTAAARELKLSYLYVDLRLADQLPLTGAYFHPGETDGPQRLTRQELTKFGTVPGIAVAYHHGPVTIYDLTGLGVPVERTGWTGDRTGPAPAVQIGIGLLAGLLTAALTARPLGAPFRRRYRAFAVASGRALTVAAALAGSCLASVALLSLHVWLGPGTFAAAGAVLLLAHLRRVRSLASRALAALGGTTVGVAATMLLAAGAAAAAWYLAVEDSAAVTVTAVQAILHGAGAP